MKQIHFIYLFFLFPFLLNAQFTPASYQIQGKILKYQVMFPEGYSENKPYPLLVFLHGAGERGDDNQKQLTHGKQFLIDNFHSKFPAIVIAPQCPADDYWANVERHQIGDSYSFRFGATDQPTTSMQVLEELIRNWIKSGKVDKSKVYVGGLSMGGMGTLELLWRLPQTFAAAFPICGGADLNKLPLYSKNTSVWLFHSDADAIVPVESSQKAYKRLKQLGCDVKYTEYKGINHNSWDSVFVEKDLAAWLFSQKLNIRKNQK